MARWKACVDLLLTVIESFYLFSIRYSDGAGNTVEENSSVFSLIRPVKNMGGWWRWALVTSPDGVVPSQMVGVSASVNLPVHHKVQKFSSGTGSPGWSGKKGHKMVVVVVSISYR